MPATTRELPVKVIFVVTLVAVALLIAIISSAEAGYYYFANRQTAIQYKRGAEHTHAETGMRIDNTDLARLKVEQTKALHDTSDGKLPIEAAMRKIADAY